jgi:streptogramin lyase
VEKLKVLEILLIVIIFSISIPITSTIHNNEETYFHDQINNYVIDEKRADIKVKQSTGKINFLQSNVTDQIEFQMKLIERYYLVKEKFSITDRFQINDSVRVFDLEIVDNEIWFSVLNSSYLWNFNLTNYELRIFLLPKDITPFILKYYNGKLWFTSYNFEFNVGQGSVNLVDTKSEIGKSYKIKTVNAGIFDLVVTNEKVWFSQWLSGKVGFLDLETENVFEIKLDYGCEVSCGPVGMYLNHTDLWISLTFANRIIKMNTSSMNYVFYNLPADFYAPVVLKESSKHIWTAAHSGNELLSFNPQTAEITIHHTPGKGLTLDPIPFIGINDFNFVNNNLIAYTQHFHKNLGFYKIDSKQTIEIALPINDPYVQWLEIQNNKYVWWLEYNTGTIGRIDIDNLPNFTITPEVEQLVVERGKFISLNIEILKNIDLNPKFIDPKFSLTGHSTIPNQIHVDATQLEMNFVENLKKTTRFNINVDSSIKLGTYIVFIGLETEYFQIHKALTITIIENEFLTVVIVGLGQYVIIISIAYLIRARRRK